MIPVAIHGNYHIECSVGLLVSPVSAVLHCPNCLVFTLLFIVFIHICLDFPEILLLLLATALTS